MENVIFLKSIYNDLRKASRIQDITDYSIFQMFLKKNPSQSK